ncbi:ABC transporter permease [Pelagibacterium sp. H642]|uniref:ABC transporter permease n=1 Tax=Pelagibacterium sp. H642 TaxID=1881069 RepID=UPI0028161A9A|nr:ABC transporter permease [Pelagibacterium sp. H642]WMT89035.1 ABC transporter permease [Pelagibacterium sp. H642]
MSQVQTQVRPTRRAEGEPGGWTVTVSRLGFLCALIVLWWIASINVSRNIIPTPLATLEAAGRLLSDGELQEAVLASISIYLSGYAVAILVAIPLGVVMGAFGLLGRTLEIYVYALSATPRVAFIPLVIVLLGLGSEAKIFIVFLGAVMPILINTYAGVRQSDPELVEMARSVGAGRLRIFTRIVLPGAVPYIIVGLRIGATIGLINTVVAELYTAVRGLGGLLAIYGNTFRMAEYFVVVLSLAAIGVVVTEGLRIAEQRLGRWRR